MVWQGCVYVCLLTFSNVFSETAWPIEVKFHVGPPRDRGNESLFTGSRSHDQNAQKCSTAKMLKNLIFRKRSEKEYNKLHTVLSCHH